MDIRPYKFLDMDLYDRVALDFRSVLKEFFPDIRIFKEFNPHTEKFVDKSYCLMCDAKDEFPTMYFNEAAYGCYNCGLRGNAMHFLDKVIGKSDEWIADYLIKKKDLRNVDRKELKRIILDYQCEEVHDIFESPEFFPDTACIHLGTPFADKILTNYTIIRKDIWSRHIPGRSPPKEIEEFYN